MDDFYDDPIHGHLVLKRGIGQTGYEGITPKALAGGKVVYMAKTRLDLNKKGQTTLPGSFRSPREAAIFLATYLKENPPVPKVAGKKVCSKFSTLALPDRISPRVPLLDSHMCPEEEGRGRGGGQAGGRVAHAAGLGHRRQHLQPLGAGHG